MVYHPERNLLPRKKRSRFVLTDSLSESSFQNKAAKGAPEVALKVYPLKAIDGTKKCPQQCPKNGEKVKM